MPSTTEETLPITEMPTRLPSAAEWDALLATPDRAAGPYIVIIYNDDWHTIDQVAHQVRKATRCTPDRAYQITMEVHTQGRSIAYAGEKRRCDEVASVLKEIRLDVVTERAV